MRVAEAMTRGAHLIKANDTIKQAAKIMAEEDVGFLPVEENDRLVGIITDRDIVVRCLARGQWRKSARARCHDEGREILLRG